MPCPGAGAALLLEAIVGKPLLDVLRELTLDPDKQAAFADDPSRYLAQYGYEDVEADHLNEAFSLVADTLPPDVAQSVAGPATSTAAPEPDDGSGGAPDTTINPDEDTFGGVDDSFDTAALNGVAGNGDSDGDDGPDLADESGDLTDGYGNGGYGTGELSLGDLTDDGIDGDAVAFGVGSEGAGSGDGADAALADGAGLTGDLAGDDGTPLLDGDAEAFALDDVGVDDGSGLGDHGFDDAPDLGDGGVPVDDVDDGPADDLTFDDVGSF